MKQIRPTQLMRTLWRAQGKCCGVCGIPMVPASSTHPIWGWTIEHVWPRGRYPYQGEGNRLISHSVCNHAKGDRDPTEAELTLLTKVNTALGLELKPRMTSWSDEASGPTAMQLAFSRAGKKAVRSPIDWSKVKYA